MSLLAVLLGYWLFLNQCFTFLVSLQENNESNILQAAIIVIHFIIVITLISNKSNLFLQRESAVEQVLNPVYLQSVRQPVQMN